MKEVVMDNFARNLQTSKSKSIESESSIEGTEQVGIETHGSPLKGVAAAQDSFQRVVGVVPLHVRTRLEAWEAAQDN